MRSKKFGIVHAYAQCDDCEWTTALDINVIDRMGKVRRQIKSHIDITGHTVTLETGNATKYLTQ